MSLNGLDATAVIEAHQNALTDAGGWFLLKYINRDTVELLNQGTGGVTETKREVEQYEEKSPLYGLVQYRRKRIVLKYVPEGTSRLLQVRLTVQFQSVLDAFPHDTVFSFTAPSELVDSALGLSTMLQPSNHSGTQTPSSASGRHHRLNEIREDGEETTPTSKEPKIVIAPPRFSKEASIQASSRSDLDGLPASALKAKALLAKRKEADLAAAAKDEASKTSTAAITTPSISSDRTATVIATAIAAAAEASVQESASRQYIHNDNPVRPLTAPTSSPPKPLFDKKFPKALTLQPSVSREVNVVSGNELAPAPPAHSANLSLVEETPPKLINHTRHLSDTETNSISQWNEQVAAYRSPAPRTKKKLAPKPHIDPGSRPKPSSTVAVLPQTIRTSTRSNYGPPSRPDSRQSSRSVPARFIPNTSVPPPMPTNPYQTSMYRQSDTRKPPSITSSAITDISSATPEKLRLMKALQLRKRNQLLSQRAASVQSSRTQASYAEFHGRNVSEVSESRSVIPVSTPASTDRVARVSAEHKSDVNSITASPTSATTASIDRSTKPSSFSSVTNGIIPSRSFSADTNSSSTPKAGAEGLQLSTKQPVNDESDSEDESDIQPPANNRSSIHEALMRLTGTTTPPIPDTVVEQPTPKSEVLPTHKELSVAPAALTTENLSVSNRQLTAKHSLLSEASSGSRGRGRRRRGVGSLHITTSVEGSEGSDEESFMEELRNATVQEAKPMSVARTPATPKMRKLSVDKIREMTRTPTLETYKSVRTTPSEADKSKSASLRSNSTTLPYWPPVSNDGSPVVPLSNKPSLGSGISKRIKALEVLTHREVVQSTSPPSPREAPIVRSSFTNLMNRASLISHSQAPNTSTDKSPPKRPTDPRSVPIPTAVSRQHTGPRPLVQRQGEIAEVFSPQRKGETISVTARIVRDRPAPPAIPHLHEPNLNLHRSPLIVEHDRRESESSHPPATQDYSYFSPDSIPISPNSDRRRFSFSSHKSGSTVKHSHVDGRTSRGPTSSREKKYAVASSETSSVTEEKRPSRANRFMKRMSGLGSRLGSVAQRKLASRDHLPPDTIHEHSESIYGRESIADSLLQVIDIGDVNVQFPESLLWKRRFLRIDDQGFLIFSPPTDNIHLRMSNRKFHLGDIRTPFLPDGEREEMSWSICLDLKDGSCIQCACESKHAQHEVLKMLVDAHNAYHSLYT